MAPYEAEGSVKRFFSRLFPPELVAYIPGAKFIAGGILYAAAQVFGIDGEVVDVVGVSVHVPAVAAFVGFYLWPSD